MNYEIVTNPATNFGTTHKGMINELATGGYRDDWQMQEKNKNKGKN